MAPHPHREATGVVISLDAHRARRRAARRDPWIAALGAVLVVAVLLAVAHRVHPQPAQDGVYFIAD